MNRIQYIIILILVSTSTIYSQTSVTPSGSGTLGDPYLISELGNLYWLSQTSSAWVADTYFEQTANIDATSTITWDSGAGFTPIGADVNYFYGNYDGNDFTIDGLTINRPSENDVALFGGASTGNIHNLGLTNANIVGGSNVGALVGVGYNTFIYPDCYSTGSVTGISAVGGLVGYADGGAVHISAGIHNCYSTATVIGTGVAFVGGLVGNNNSWISNSYCTGSVTGTSSVGGLAGYNNVQVAYSYSTGSVTGTLGVGGLVGNTTGSGTIIDSYCRGNVTRMSGTSSYIGAFCGTSTGVVERCYSTGSVTYTGDTDPTDKGFIGDDNGTYSNNFWDSDVSNQTTGFGATAKTTAQMKNVATFTDLTTVGLSSPVWDFETNPNDDVANADYWDMTPFVIVPKIRVLGKIMNIDDGYPFLAWQNGAETALPVELTSFSLKNTPNGVLCTWTTEGEFENLGFAIERRKKDGDWEEIVNYKNDNTLIGQGTTSIPTDYKYCDKLIEPNTTYEYRLLDIDYNGKLTRHDEKTITTNKAQLSSKLEQFTVLPAYPNPFNPSTTITYGLEENSNVTISIYNLSGKLITTLLNTEKQQGWHSIEWNGTDRHNNQVPAGIYISRITSNNTTKTSKLMLLK